MFRPPPMLLSTRNISGSGLNNHLLLSPYQVRWYNKSKVRLRDSGDIYNYTLKKRHQINQNPFQLKIVHYIFLSSSFSLVNYLSVRASFLRIVPNAIYLHCYKEPEHSTHDILSKPMITKVIIHKPVTRVFGRPVVVLEHQADVLIMIIILKYGCIYIDGDVIPLQSFDRFLYHQKPMTMGYENVMLKRLPNTIPVGQRNNSFLHRWFQEYQTFDDSLWGVHSVILPGKLAEQYPNEINLEGVKVFFYPSYTSNIYFRHNGMKQKLKDNYAVHLWNHVNRQYLRPLTPSLIYDCDMGLNEILRPLVPDPFVSFSINLDAHKKGLKASKLYDTLVGIAQQSFPLWEILINTNIPNLYGLSYTSGSQSEFNSPYYSCNLTALATAYVGKRMKIKKMSSLKNFLGRRNKGSVFLRLRCGRMSTR